MTRFPRTPLGLILGLCGVCSPLAQPLPNTEPLTAQGDLAAQMVSGIDAYLDRELAAAPAKRAALWQRDRSSPEAYDRSVEPNRARLRTLLGVVDQRSAPQLRYTAAASGAIESENRAEVGSGPGFRVYAVAWAVFRGVEGEGLLLVPDGEVRADVVAIPDCDWTPEQSIGLAPGVPPAQQFPRRLAASGCRVLVPALIDRSDTASGLERVRKIKHSQREVLWRAAYEMGRTIQGYETQKILAAVDLLSQRGGRKVGVFGYGEGGLLAAYAGALDPRIAVTGISGYHMTPNLHQEPIYRNVWAITTEFGAGELAGLFAPRQFVLEQGQFPVAEYPAPGQSHSGAAPGRLGFPDPAESRTVSDQAGAWLDGVPGVDAWKIVSAGRNEVGTDETLTAFLAALGVQAPPGGVAAPVQPGHPVGDVGARLRRQYAQILEDTQWLMRESEFTRKEFWSKADRTDAKRFAESAQWYRDYFRNELVGVIPKASMPPRPRTRKVSETPKFIGYEVVLDVHPDVFAYGILLIPKGIPAGEKRAVVVCQHGLEGRPRDVADPTVDNPAYHAYACRLAEQGYVTFSPQNCYIGQNVFRQVLRKAQPLKLTLWSFIQRQHEVILDWLAAQEFVDPARMAFYGLSYGGKTAMRIPPLIDRYCLSICSADYNEWIWKNVSIRHGYCYLGGGEYDMPEFNLGNTFNYAELSWLILPRPFMVERGHDDGVAPDEWVAYEFAKTRRQYVKLGLGDRAEIEFFDGPHTIHGKGTFDFLRRQLK